VFEGEGVKSLFESTLTRPARGRGRDEMKRINQPEAWAVTAVDRTP